MSENAPAIEVVDLSYDYHGQLALDGLSFSIPAGARVALVGPNGAGKSTLILHLNGLLNGKGTVRVAGTEITRRSLPTVRGQVGLVFPDPEDQLFMPTLEEDVAFGPRNMGLSPEEARERARRALEIMGLGDFGSRSSHHLSDGERRRAAIATVLSMQPRIWVLDEPAANLDPRGRRELIEVLQSLEGTILLASHDLDLVVQVCERCLLLDRGRLVKQGDTRTILSDSGLMEQHGLEVPLRLDIASQSPGGREAT